MANTANAATFRDGISLAQPVHLVDANGNPITSTNPLNVNATFSGSSVSVTGGSVNIADGNTPSQKVSVDANGNMRTQVIDSSATATISAAQPVIGTPVSNATLVLTLGQGQSTWKVQLLAGGGGFTSGTTFVVDKSVDGGTTWYSASFKVSGASPNTPVSSVVGPGPVILTGDCAAANRVRVRCSVLNASETIVATMRASVGVSDIGLLTPLPAGSNVIGSAMLQTVSGTALVADQSNTELRVSNYGKNSTAGDTAIAVNSAGDVKVAGDFTELSGLSAGSLNADLIPSTDVSAYRWVSIQILGTWSGTLTFQGSNDNSNWVSISLGFTNSGTSSMVQSSGSNNVYSGPLTVRYLRVRMTSYSSGTATGVAELYTATGFPPTLGVQAAQSGNWNSRTQDGSGNSITSNAGAINVAQAHSNGVVGAGGTSAVVIKGSAGYLSGVVVTATGSANLLIYDNASAGSGTVIGVIPLAATLGQYFPFNMPAANGITAQQASGSPAVTVAFS